jgi:hypothetical protein
MWALVPHMSSVSLTISNVGGTSLRELACANADNTTCECVDSMCTTASRTSEFKRPCDARSALGPYA